MLMLKLSVRLNDFDSVCLGVTLKLAAGEKLTSILAPIPLNSTLAFVPFDRPITLAASVPTRAAALASPLSK